MQLHQLVDKALAQGAGLLAAQCQFRWQVRAQNDALDPLHHIELGADQAFVSAMRVGLGAVGEGLAELVEDAELAAHVMG